MTFSPHLAALVHVYISYTLVGGTILYLLAVAHGRLGSYRADGYAPLLFLSLMFPLPAYYLIHLVVPAIGWQLPTLGPPSTWPLPLQVLCRLGERAAVSGGVLGVVLVAVVLGRVFVSWLAVRQLVARLRQDNLPYSGQIRRLWLDLASRMGVRGAELHITGRQDACCFTCGFWRPVVVISRGLVENLEPEEIEAVLAHELAHIRRKDILTGMVVGIFRDLAFFSPAAHLAAGKLAESRELQADALAVTITGKPLTYAGTLIKVWRGMPGGQAGQVLDPGVAWMGGGQVARRVDYLLHTRPTSAGILWTLVMALAIVAILPVLNVVCQF